MGEKLQNNAINKIYKIIYYQLIKRNIYAITGPFRLLPDFIIIGAMRCGTTSLYYDLCEHPNILSAAYDEIGYFDSNYELGLNWYRSMFPTKIHRDYVKHKKNFCITGEDTPFYFWKPKAAQRIYELIPNVRLIAILRDPVDRAYSEYRNGVRFGGETRSFEELIKEDLERMDKVDNIFEKCERVQSIVARGIYADQLQIWYDIFKKDQIMLVNTKELSESPGTTLNSVFDFLDLPNYNIKNPQKRKVFNYTNMNDEIRKLLIDFFKPHNERLYKLLDRDFGWS